jgi:hypothetical protein
MPGAPARAARVIGVGGGPHDRLRSTRTLSPRVFSLCTGWGLLYGLGAGARCRPYEKNEANSSIVSLARFRRPRIDSRTKSPFVGPDCENATSKVK